ncbi:response regulator transcription factor [Streptomyces sp. NPDC001389]|uniref:response regulator transcription factor n=1 Tax=Streptomyces sp. NPDC001389 TaxID=3364569 RepID=UPI00367BA13C
MPQLTDRQLAVLELAADGLTYREIARRLGIGPAAVANRAEHATRNLGARTIAHAVLLACRAGLLDGRPQRHGDHAGYEAHRRRGEQPCDACREGEREHSKRQWQAEVARRSR